MKKYPIILLLLVAGIAYSQRAQGQTVYGRNLITISPVQLSEQTVTGVGLQYERFVGDKFSVYLPVAYAFGHSSPCDPTIKARVLHAYPGIKFYPLGTQHRVSYSFGPSLGLGKGTTNCNCGDPVPLTTETTVKTYKPIEEVGVLVNNAVNFMATSHMYIGGEAGIGATLINKLGGKDMGTDLMLQMNLRVGYRF